MAALMEQLIIRVRRPFLAALAASAQAKLMPLDSYLGEIVESYAADLRLHSIAAQLAFKRQPLPMRASKQDRRGRPSISIQKTSKAVSLLQQGFSCATIAERCGISVRTAYRIEAAYRASEHVLPSVHGGNGGGGVAMEGLQYPGPKWRNSTGS